MGATEHTVQSIRRHHASRQRGSVLSIGRRLCPTTVALSILASAVFWSTNYANAQPWLPEVKGTIAQENAQLADALERLRALRKDNAEQQSRLGKAKSAAETNRAALAQIQQRIDAIEADRQKTISDLSNATANPELISPEKVQELQQRNADLSRKLRVERGNYEQQQALTKRSDAQVGIEAHSLEDLRNRISNTATEIITVLSNKTEIVETDATCNINRNITAQQCEEQAQADAERQAVEKGAQSFIRAQTEMRNFQITSDIVFRDINAHIVRKDVKSDFLPSGSGMSQLGGYRVHLVAAVKNIPRQEQANSYPGPNDTIVDRQEPSKSQNNWDQALSGTIVGINGFPGLLSTALSGCDSCYFNQWGIEIIFPFRLSVGISQAHGATTLLKQSASGYKYNETYRGTETNLELLYYVEGTHSIYHGFGGLISIASSGSGEETRYNSDGTPNSDGTEPITGHQAYGFIYSALFPISDHGLIGFRLMYQYLALKSSGQYTPNYVDLLDAGLSIGYRF